MTIKVDGVVVTVKLHRPKTQRGHKRVYVIVSQPKPRRYRLFTTRGHAYTANLTFEAMQRERR